MVLLEPLFYAPNQSPWEFLSPDLSIYQPALHINVDHDEAVSETLREIAMLIDGKIGRTEYCS